MLWNKKQEAEGLKEAALALQMGCNMIGQLLLEIYNYRGPQGFRRIDPDVIDVEGHVVEEEKLLTDGQA